jgi:hypothetical protein
MLIIRNITAIIKSKSTMVKITAASCAKVVQVGHMFTGVRGGVQVDLFQSVQGQITVPLSSPELMGICAHQTKVFKYLDLTRGTRLAKGQVNAKQKLAS